MKLEDSYTEIEVDFVGLPELSAKRPYEGKCNVPRT